MYTKIVKWTLVVAPTIILRSLNYEYENIDLIIKIGSIYKEFREKVVYESHWNALIVVNHKRYHSIRQS